MKIIVCGAGKVGYSITRYLAEDGHDVTVIDQDEELIGEINENTDAKGIIGYASNPDVLKSASANDADMVIAVTASDEVNMVACQIAHSLFNVPKKIARIRRQSYLQPAWANLFSREHMPIDVIISPEVIVAEEINKRLLVPGTSYVSSMANGRAHVLGVICDKSSPFLGSGVAEIHTLFADISFQIIAIQRRGEFLFPSDNTFIEEQDELFFIVDTKDLRRIMGAFGHEEQEARKVVIFGGGNIGYGLAKLLKPRGRGVQIKIIEPNYERALYLSEKLQNNAIILEGSALDREILREADIKHAETAIAVTNDDESNILGSLLAKQFGCERVISLVNNNAYSGLIGSMGIDTIVSPRSIIVAAIMQHVRKGRIKGLHDIGDGFAEIVEAEISDISKIVNVALGEIDIPEDVKIIAIVRDEDVIIPDEEFVLREKDHIIVMAPHDTAHNIDTLFSVKVDIF